ncbi:MAG: hypothetical protein M1830_008382 [Pleopsidium flavum]|nr:MAG: hypothetical protein M1830_008382 [Pleopsidium flavum]
MAPLSLREIYNSLLSKTCFASPNDDTNSSGPYTRIVETTSTTTTITNEKTHHLYSPPATATTTTTMTETKTPFPLPHLHRRALLRPNFHSPDLPPRSPPRNQPLDPEHSAPYSANDDDDDPNRNNFSYDTVNMLSGVVSATAGTIGLGTGVMTLRQLRGQMRERARPEVDLELGLDGYGGGGGQGEAGGSRAAASSVMAVNVEEGGDTSCRGEDVVWTGMR